MDQLVQQTLLAGALEEVPPSVEIQIENETRNLRATATLRERLEGAVSEDAVRAAYEERVAGQEPQTEYRAAHILVDSEEAAREAIAEIEGGAEFADVARARSTGPSGPRGGDLGFFAEGMMVEPFQEAVEQLEPGEVSEPVETQFGWHVIRLEETREASAPPFETLGPEIAAELPARGGHELPRRADRGRGDHARASRGDRPLRAVARHHRVIPAPTAPAARAGAPALPPGATSRRGAPLDLLPGAPSARRREGPGAGAAPFARGGDVPGVIPRSPLAPAGDPVLPAVAGVRLATGEAGVRYQGRTDVMLAELCPGTALAGVFTRSATRAAPVLDAQAKIGADPSPGAAIVVNSGNANAFTGRHGEGSVQALCAAVADTLGVPVARVLTASTGVIGERLPHERIVSALGGLAGNLREGGLLDAARAIMTTDTYPKGASEVIDAPGGPVTVAGIAKGSGMIAPDMATMLAFVFTDARVGQDRLQAMLPGLAARTFNRVTVDGDTSTSDTVLVAATGRGPEPGEAALEAALERVMLSLAHQIVRDGEGATKFVAVTVTGAASDADAHRAARAVAESPLVKTAVAGSDPNWGRVVMAVGKSGARADRDRLAIRIGPVEAAREGWVSPLYDEAAAAAHMRGAEVTIAVDLGIGRGEATVWTCDLTARYVEINADYRS